ncbi:MAG: FHA domain-containing protein [Rhodanobacteraceae bacterium]
MRLSFPNGEHADVVVKSGTMRIGTAAENDICLAGPDVGAAHASVSVDARGIVLSVLDTAARTHVNARPVREKALLRLGDVLSLGTVTAQIKADADDVIATTVPVDGVGASSAESPMPSRTVLRGMSGAHFGKSIVIDRKLVIGRNSDCDLSIDEPALAPRHAVIELRPEAILLRDLGSTTGTLVNGVMVKDAMLHPGDQLVFANRRFLLEAPGMPMRGQSTPIVHAASITQTMSAIDVQTDTPPPPSSASRDSIWWLIGAAALIGFGLTALLLWGI